MLTHRDPYGSIGETHPFNTSAIISSDIYVQSDAHLNILGSKQDLQETLIRIMEISGTGGVEDRIDVLEKKVRQMDALVSGLLNELLDLKSVYTKMSQHLGEYRIEEPVEAPAAPATVASDGSTLVRPKVIRPDAPAAPAEPEMVRIMQSDGTMKMEPRSGDPSMTGHSVGYGHDMKNNPLKRKPVR